MILGVTGSIAAHKAVDLCSQLTRQGCEVHVVLTAHAQRFVTALPFRTLSRHPVVTDLFHETDAWQPPHIALAGETDLLLIAPATAHVIARLALGLANDALSCIALALNPHTPLLIAPAMHAHMWLHPATQHNAAILKSRGAQFLGPESGLLSSGDHGIGRLLAVDVICRETLARLRRTPPKRRRAK